MKVYLAGKISQNDWRTSFEEYRPFSIDASDVVDDTNEKNINAYDFENFFGDLPVVCKHPYIEVAGPFFISCDHGCYHGNETHGVGAVDKKDFSGHDVQCGCSGITFSHSEVASICLNQIKKSDMVFAYINDATCYGTLFEIGYAVNAGKPVAVMFDGPLLMDQMWFVCECSNAVYCTDGDFCINKPFPYQEEAAWIANRIAYKFYGNALWVVTGGGITEEEGQFYSDNCHLSSKEQYHEYLKTDWWQKIRVERLKIDGYKCVNCGADKNLQVHHTDYSKGWFHEDPRQDLLTLCKKCHEEKAHGNK